MYLCVQLEPIIVSSYVPTFCLWREDTFYLCSLSETAQDEGLFDGQHKVAGLQANRLEVEKLRGVRRWMRAD